MNWKSILKHYSNILEKKEEPYFQLCKKVCINFSKVDPLKKLWELHKKGIELLKQEKFADNPKKNLLDLKIEIVKRLLKECILCERRCKVNRYEKIGFCGVGINPRISSIFPHFGEEDMLIPSGTVFFSGCNFNCVYCQNWDISQFPQNGEFIEEEKLVEWFNRNPVINVNLVGGEPTPNLLYVLKFLRKLNLNLPIIWNSNMYMSIETMNILDGVVDLYLSDFKYGNNKCAKKLSNVDNYFEIVSRNHLIAVKQADLLIRHLVLPNHIKCCSYRVLEWIAKNVGKNCIVNIMSQYWPAYRAMEYEDINRRITREEYYSVVKFAEKLGLNYMIQPML